MNTAGGGKVRQRNSMAKLSRVLDSQSTERDEEDDVESVIGSRPSSFNHANSAIVNANGSVPCAAGAENNGFDAEAETTPENRPEQEQTADKPGVKTVKAEVTSEASAQSNVSTARDSVLQQLSKKVLFAGLKEEPKENEENSIDESSRNTSSTCATEKY